MNAALFDEAGAVAPARNLHVVRETTSPQASAPKKVTRRADALPFIGHDPVVDGIALLLTVPVRHAYAALLRVGLLEVRA